LGRGLLTFQILNNSMPQLARGDYRDRKRWKAAHRMPMHPHMPAPAQLHRVAARAYTVLAAVEARLKG
jgi:hypothetical protein